MEHRPDVIVDLKSHARVLHRRAIAGDPAALERLRVLPEFARSTDPASIMRELKRAQCLSAVARALGFQSWPHARTLLGGGEDADFGTLLYPDNCFGHWNIWSAHYTEAQEIRAAHGGYLLAYRKQFLIVDAGYIVSLGLDPHDPDWEAIGRDWVRPREVEARTRLYRKLVHNALVTMVLSET
jgi:hypothetical protein